MKLRYFFSAFIFLAAAVFAGDKLSEPYQGLEVKKISVAFENQSPSEGDESQNIIHGLQTKTGQPFDQDVFDSDLKDLSEKYDWVEPRLTIENHEINVHLLLRKRPVIVRFEVSGSSYRSNKLLKEAELQSGATYNRETFYKSINKMRDFLIKKGYFKVDISYVLEPVGGGSNEVVVKINVNEGPRGRISEIVFEGFTKKEQSEILGLIRSKKFNILVSWLTGSGTIREDQMDPDIQVIVHHMQNEGYVDAHVTMKIEELKSGKMGLIIHLDRGEKYFIHDVTFSGSTLRDVQALRKAASIQPGETFSIDKIQEAQEHIKELFTKDGYLQTTVNYTLTLSPSTPEYDVHFTIEESDQSRVGLVLISGNYATTKNVIYNNIQIEPGEVFDTTKLKATQEKLQSTGYFKTVNVYPVKPENIEAESTEYRDVMIEVDETQTGNASLFAGFDSNQNVYGGIDLTENNFSLLGFKECWYKGFSAFRGAGEFFQVKGSIGLKEQGVDVSWLNPYIFDTLWRFGFSFNYNRSQVISNEYTTHTLGGGLNATYPLSSYLSYGFAFRVKDAFIIAASTANPPTKAEVENNGIISGLGTNINLDTTDNSFKPRKGIRCRLEGEFAGVSRGSVEYNDFPFLKYASLNAAYIPLWKKATFKARAEARFISPLWDGQPEEIPIPERFFLGGESTVRGYYPGKIGAGFANNGSDPKGGVSSVLLSAEISQNIVRPLDVFVFLDAGSITLKQFDAGPFRASFGGGIRVDVGRRLPFVVGYGFPINAENKAQVQGLFFSMAGQF